jgi:hypothetical protein
MTRKDYVLIAKAITDARAKVTLEAGEGSQVLEGANAGLYELARILSNEFQMENPRFNDNRFMVACEVLHN